MINVHVTPLPIHGESKYIIERVDRLIDSESASLSDISRLLSTLIDYILSEFVAPAAPESILSLYLTAVAMNRGSQVDRTLTNRLSELGDLCVKLADVFNRQRQCLQSQLVLRFDAISRMNKRVALAALRTASSEIRNKGSMERVPSLPFLAGSQSGSHAIPSEGIDRCPGKGKAPSLPHESKLSAAPQIPSLAKGSGPPLGGVTKGTAPALPGQGKVCAPPFLGAGKGTAPSLPGIQSKQFDRQPCKGSAPALPKLGKGKAPGLPAPGAKSTANSSAPVLPGNGHPRLLTPQAPIGTLKQSPTVQAPEVCVFDIEAPPVVADPIDETRKVHWQSLPLNRFSQSVFEVKLVKRKSDFENACIDPDAIKAHFVKQKNSGSGIESPYRSINMAPTAACSPIGSAANLAVVPSVLETKRIQQIEIFLNGRKGLVSLDVVNLLKSGGNEENIDLLEALLPIYPSEEERGLLEAQASKEGAILGKADSFLIDLMRIPNFKIASNYIVVLHSTDLVAQQIIGYFQNFISFVDKLISCPALPALLKIVGSTVVYLWNGKRANLNGFSLEAISQLKKVHSYTNKEYTMLHCVVETAGPDIVKSVLASLSPVEQILEFDYNDTVLRSEEIERSVQALKPSDRLDGAYFPILIDRLTVFRTRMESDVLPNLSSLRDEVKRKTAELLRYFAESDKKSVNEFLATVNILRFDLAASAKRRLI
jgi:hypothetical protein